MNLGSSLGNDRFCPVFECLIVVESNFLGLYLESDFLCLSFPIRRYDEKGRVACDQSVNDPP